MTSKKLEQESRNLGINELYFLFSSYNNYEAEHFRIELIRIIKKILSRLFQIEPNYTFEELRQKIENFDKESSRMVKKLELLNNEKETFFKSSRGKKKDNAFFSHLKELDKKILQEEEKYGSCQHISKVLKNSEIRLKLVFFLNELSNIQFSRNPVNKQKLMKIVFDFLLIVNNFSHKLPYKISMIERIAHKFSKEHRGNASASIDDFSTMIIEAEKAIKEGNDGIAIEMYKKLHNLYADAATDTKVLIYKDLFNLWFRINFNEAPIQ